MHRSDVDAPGRVSRKTRQHLGRMDRSDVEAHLRDRRTTCELKYPHHPKPDKAILNVTRNT